ncbi:MAG: hypothetical protein OEV26_05705 [Gallionella sp.]|nr:hypothetical protein [Gallionella sp.]MDH4286900.1 hypothetical protein [Gallionella sp.]
MNLRKRGIYQPHNLFTTGALFALFLVYALSGYMLWLLRLRKKQQPVA